MHSTNKDIIHLANLIGRTPNSIALRLVNFASVDPILRARGIKGMDGGTKIVQPIWDEFFNNQEELVFLSEQILAQKENTSIENKYEDLLFDMKDLRGEMVTREVKTRVNQSVFRQMVLANYNTKCAITGIDIPKLLLASHIVPWSKNEKERLNPENGICLSPLYDKAFDFGLIAVNTNYEIINIFAG
jgi:putative restriction endonuclease